MSNAATTLTDTLEATGRTSSQILSTRQVTDMTAGSTFSEIQHPGTVISLSTTGRTSSPIRTTMRVTDMTTGSPFAGIQNRATLTSLSTPISSLSTLAVVTPNSSVQTTTEGKDK